MDRIESKLHDSDSGTSGASIHQDATRTR
jgi:hypothetical protein